MAPKSVLPARVTTDPQRHEEEHVHAVYDKIAPHFSSTRYKPWPIISAFLSSLPDGAVGLDAGTGNGKYLPLPLDRPSGCIHTIGLDRSINLLKIAQTAGTSAGGTAVRRDVVLGDVLHNYWRVGAFDYAISIATIHHLATHERRRVALQRLLQSVSPNHGRVLIYVWAIEQDDLSKRSVPLAETTSNDGPRGQDVFVPWAYSEPKSSQPEAKAGEPQVFNRYYHMFADGELPGLVHEAAGLLGLNVGEPQNDGDPGDCGVQIVQNGWERSNYYMELVRWSRPRLAAGASA